MSNKLGVFYRFLVSYILILLIPLVMGSFIYHKAFGIIQDEAVSSSLSMIKQSMDILDTRLKEIQGVTQQLSLSQNTSKLLVTETDYSLYLNMQKDLLTYRVNNNFIRDCIIYIKDEKVLITPVSCTNREAIFYKGFFKSGGMDYESWHKDFWSKKYVGEFIPSIINPAYTSAEKTSVNYVLSLPIENFNADARGIIIIDINVNEIERLLANLAGENGWAYIADEKGEVIASVNKDNSRIDYLSIDDLEEHGDMGSLKRNPDFIVSYSISPYNGWLYVLGAPTGMVMNKVNAIKNITIVILLVVVVLGSLLSLFLANRNSLPIRKLVDIIKGNLSFVDDGEKNNTFEFIHGSISELLRTNKELRSEIQEKVPILRAAFLERLFRGNFIKMSELNGAMKNTGIDLAGCKYSVLILKIEGCKKTGEDGMLNELNIAKVVTSKAISNVFKDRVLLHEISEDMLAGLLVFNFNDEQQIRNVVRNIASEVGGLLMQNNEIYVSFASGLAYSSLADIYNSYREALEALRYNAVVDEDVVRWYVQSPEQRSYYYYPLEIETKLINLCSNGDEKETLEILDLLYAENFVNRSISGSMLFTFLYEIRGTLIKIASRSKLKSGEMLDTLLYERIESVVSGESAEVDWERIKALYSFMCSKISSELNKDKSEDILEYLHNYYMDQQISRASVASRFNMTEVHLSKFFKEQTGEYFSHYLEKIRMEKAKRLINESELPISKIAEQVGYNSVRTFRRAYKRYCGDIPSSLRQG